MDIFLNFRPPRIGFALVGLAVLAYYFLPGGQIIFLQSYPVGSLLLFSGFGIMTWAWHLFKAHSLALPPTAPIPEKPVLLAKGPYHFTRNPMYLGMLLQMLALALMAGAWPFFVSSALFFGIINYAFCPFEEQKMEKSVGAEYTAYKSRVRRWI